MVVLIALPFLLGGGTIANFTPVWPNAAGGSTFTGMMAAMVSVLWAYDGWTNITPLAEEVQRAGPKYPARVAAGGTAVLIAVYVSMTLAYHYVLPMGEVASASREAGHVEKAVAAVYCQHLLGRNGVVGISILVMCSTFISLNGNALTGPAGVFRDGARDGLFPRGHLPESTGRFKLRPMPSSHRGSGRSS